MTVEVLMADHPFVENVAPSYQVANNALVTLNISLYATWRLPTIKMTTVSMF